MGVLAAWAFGVGVDWIWELTAVTFVAVISYALLVGPASGPAATAQIAAPRAWQPTFTIGIVVLALAWCAVCVEGLPLLAATKLDSSRAAAGRGHLRVATSDALAARALEPWAATPYLQLALLSERRGELKAAHYYILEAISRDSRDWGLWLTRTRIEAKLGEIAEARKSLDHTRILNPRSPLLQGQP
jgi:hypothetical protein